MCVCVCVVEMQSQCGSTVVHSYGTCQAGSNVGQTPQGFSYPVVSLSLPLIHSLLAIPQRTGHLFTSIHPEKKLIPYKETTFHTTSNTELLYSILGKLCILDKKWIAGRFKKYGKSTFQKRLINSDTLTLPLFHIPFFHIPLQ